MPRVAQEVSARRAGRAARAATCAQPCECPRQSTPGSASSEDGDLGPEHLLAVLVQSGVSSDQRGLVVVPMRGAGEEDLAGPIANGRKRTASRLSRKRGGAGDAAKAPSPGARLRCRSVNRTCCEAVAPSRPCDDCRAPSETTMNRITRFTSGSARPDGTQCRAFLWNFAIFFLARTNEFLAGQLHKRLSGGLSGRCEGSGTRRREFS